jgi:hypothetical protein
MPKQVDSTTPESAALLTQRIEANLYAARSGLPGNVYETVNAFNLGEARRDANKAYYDAKGETMPAAAWVLAGDAERKIRHNRTLRRNLKQADPLQTGDALFDVHHIVARLHHYAYAARHIMFSWGVAINDAANGIFLPRNFFIQNILGSSATPHQILHTERYYFYVTFRLNRVKAESTEAVRAVLASIKAELLAGTFPY